MDEEILKSLAEGTGAKPRPVARAIGVSDNGFYEAIKRGEVDVVRIGRRIIVPAREVRRLLGVETQEAA